MKCIKPMLARIGSKADLERDGYIYEPKLDGIRATYGWEGDGYKVFNRSCRDVSARYPEFAFADALNAESGVLDGEIVLYDGNGNPDFTALMQRHLGTGRIGKMDRAIRFGAFDILQKNGEDLTGLPLLERKAILGETVTSHPHLEIVIYTRESRKLWEFVRKRSLEGVIAKRDDAPYEVGRRTWNWIKIKSFDTIDAVIVGYTSDKRAVSSLALAVYDDGELRFIGKVGTGLSARDVKMLREMLDAARVENPSFPPPDGYRDIEWVEPKHVAEVRYLEFGKQGMLRNPSFLRLRTDKSPQECLLEAQIS